jgi:hypothetical protein
MKSVAFANAPNLPHHTYSKLAKKTFFGAVLPLTRWWDRPQKFFFYLPSPEHKNRGLDYSAVGPPYWPYLGPRAELEDNV